MNALSISEVNKQPIKVLKISQLNGATLTSTNLPIEDIENEKYLEYEYQTFEPPNMLFINSYNCWQEHQKLSWTTHENDPSVDADKFAHAPDKFKEIVLTMVGCIMIGDSVVLDRISNGITHKITSIEARAMFTDQESRETVHKSMYSKMLNVSPDSAYYRSKEFKDKYMGRFERIVDHYKSDDIRIVLYFIMLCENILFAPMFQTICYLATLGYAPKLCDSNLLVMRDEFVHYQHARLLMSAFNYKIDTLFAREILHVFKNLVIDLLHEIVADYSDGTYNLQHVTDHFNHVVYGFMLENSLFLTDEEREFDGKRYGKSPAEKYMLLPACELKINLMESNSTIYMVDGNNVDIDMNF